MPERLRLDINPRHLYCYLYLSLLTAERLPARRSGDMSVLINVVTLGQARLVPGWVTIWMGKPPRLESGTQVHSTHRNALTHTQTHRVVH